MQIILASAKIMNDRSATKGDACQSKKLKSIPDISLSLPRFQKEAEGFARDMAQYSVDTIAEMLGCSQQIAAQKGFTFEPKLGERLRVGERSSWTSQAAEPSAGMPDFPHFIKQ